ncbi:MotA [Alphaproteobacteria bacterium 46_93_T64]|nr:MotA [Alphaproteobacteria bacterium 46_93_T64]
MKHMAKSLGILILSILAIHLIYVGYIWPEAEHILEASKQAGTSAPRDLIIILKDAEQEICFILMLWGIFLIGDRCFNIVKDGYLYDVDLLDTSGAEEEGLSSILSKIENLPVKIRSSPLIQTLTSSIRRYLITDDVQNTSDAIETSVDALALRQEAGNSMIRYLIWAIPSIGFIGTVRGIGAALSQADQALAGDISGMTNSLGVAFNSTLVALVISILLMFLLHQLQRLQDNQIVDTQAYCEKFLLNRISKLGDL